MNELPAITLLQQAHAVPHTGEELEVLGKYAASKYINGSCKTLTEAVVETVKHAGLSPEQVRRVVEFTNVTAYLTEHNKESSDHKYVEFSGGPADPAEVLRDLNDGGGGTVFDRGNADYSLMPKAASSPYGPSMLDIAGDMGGDYRKAYSLPGYNGATMDPFGEKQKQFQVKALSAMTGRSPVVVKHAAAMGGMMPPAGQPMDPLAPPPPTLGDESNALAGGEALPPQGEQGSELEGYLADGQGQAQGQGAYDPMQDHMKLMQQHIKLLQQREGVGAPKTASLDFAPAETALVEALVREERPYDYANPLQDSLELYDKLAGAVDHMTSDILSTEAEFHTRLEDVYQHVKQAALQGVTLGQILAAWQEIVPSGEYVKTAFAHIGPRLAEEEVFHNLDEVGASLQKTAHVGFVNPEHPIVGSMAAYCLTLDKLAELSVAQDELIHHRDELHAFLYKTAAGGLAGKAQGVARAAGGPAGDAAEWLTKQVVGEGGASQAAKKIVGGAVAYAPEELVVGGGLVGGKALNDHWQTSDTKRLYNERFGSMDSPERQMYLNRIQGGLL